MDTKRLYVDFHVLQTVPPSCVNRDDTGSPQTGDSSNMMLWISLMLASCVEARHARDVHRGNERCS